MFLSFPASHHLHSSLTSHLPSSFFQGEWKPSQLQGVHLAQGEAVDMRSGVWDSMRNKKHTSKSWSELTRLFSSPPFGSHRRLPEEVKLTVSQHTHLHSMWARVLHSPHSCPALLSQIHFPYSKRKKVTPLSEMSDHSEGGYLTANLVLCPF